MALKTTTSEEVQAHINSSSKDFEILGTELALSLLYGVPYPSLDNALRSTTSLNTLTLFLESIVPSHGILNALQDNKSVQTLHAIFAEDSFDGALSKLGQSFGSLLLNTKTITTLKLEFALRSQNCVQDFCNGLSANQSLTSLSMIECFVDDNALSAIVPALKHNTTLKSLDLSSTSLGTEGCKHLGEILRTNISLSNLTLRKPYNKVPSEGWKYIFEGLKTNTALTELDISQNKITDIQVCNYMSDMFLYNRSLMHIDMNGNKIGSAGLNLMLQDLDIKPPLRLTTINLHDTKLDSACCEVLCNYVSVNENMMELDLSYNNIQAEGCKWIGTMLANNKTLTVLNMTNNKIGSQGAQWLASGLRVNRRLIDLVLQDCGITSDGCTHIAHALALNPCVMHVNLNGNDIGAQGCSALVTAMHTNHSVTALSITKDRKISDVSLNELIDAQNRNKIIHRTQLVNVMTTLINMARMTDDVMSVFPLEIWQRIFKQCVCGGVPGFDQIAMDLFTGLVDCRDIAQLVKMKIVRKRGKSILVKPSTSNK